MRPVVVLTAVVSSVLLGVWGALAGLLVGWIPGLVAGAVAGVALGAFYGAVAGMSGVYSRRRLGQFVVDHTWSALNTVIGALFLLVNLARGNRVDTEFSEGRGHLGLRQGLLRGWATTIGPVQAGTGHGLDLHEAVHVLQARLFGPLYLPLIGLNYVVATVLPYWLLYHDRQTRPIDNVRAYFQRGVYPHTWHEEWAYRVQGTPPL